MPEQNNQSEQQKKYRIKVTTPVGTWVSVPLPYEEIEDIVDGVTIGHPKAVFFATEEGSVSIRAELMKQSVLEVIEESEENPQVDSEGWIENTGKQPVDDHVLVDVKFTDGNVSKKSRAKTWTWNLDDPYPIVHWHLSK